MYVKTIGSAVIKGFVGGALWPIIFCGHRTDESRGAVTALGTATHGHLVLYRVKFFVLQSFGGDDLLAVKRCCRDETRVDRRPASSAVGIGAGDHDCTCPAFTFRTAFLGCGQALVAEKVQGILVWGSLKITRLSVDRNLRG